MISRPEPSLFPAFQETGYLPFITDLFELVQFKYDSLKKKHNNLSCIQGLILAKAFGVWNAAKIPNTSCLQAVKILSCMFPDLESRLYTKLVSTSVPRSEVGSDPGRGGG